MLGKRSRQGCEECRKRRRKCDEAKPVCGPCASFRRTCNYTLKVVWDGWSPAPAAEAPPAPPAPPLPPLTHRKTAARGQGGAQPAPYSTAPAFSVAPARRRGPASIATRRRQSLLQAGQAAASAFSPPSEDPPRTRTRDEDAREEEMDANVTPGETAATALAFPLAPSTAPLRLPNGLPLAPPFQRLLDYFTQNVLASLSVHPSIHRDLCQGLVPTMLRSPHLLSAGLALAAAGLASRGLSDVAGVRIARVVEHLQSSGLALLRQALQRGLRNSVLMATCLLWCLADVFAAGGRDHVAASSSSSSSPDDATSGARPSTASRTSPFFPSSISSSSPSSSTPSSPSSSPSAPSSWRIHLQGVKALLGGDQAFDAFVTGVGSSRSAMRHLYQLYLSLQTLPYVPPTRRAGRQGGGDHTATTPVDTMWIASPRCLPRPSDTTVSLPDFHTTDGSLQTMQAIQAMPLLSAAPRDGDGIGLSQTVPPRIDGFLGYSEELLDILQQIDYIANMPGGGGTAAADTADAGLATVEPTNGDPLAAPHLSGAARAAAHVLLGKALGLVRRDAATALPVSTIAAPELSAVSGREFVLCHRCFQQATLIHLYRRLFRLPSAAPPIRAAVDQIQRMANQMTQGVPCSTWVAMSMPLCTVGCEAHTPSQQAWAHASLDTLAASIGSMHVRVVQQALEDMWRLRARRGDTDGRLCAGALLDELNYNIILF